METANIYRNSSDVYIDVDIEFTFRLDSFRTKATWTGTGWKYIEELRTGPALRFSDIKDFCTINICIHFNSIL